MSANNLLDPTFNGMPGSEMYRSEVFPDLWPNEKPMLLENWSPEERGMFIGGEEAKAFYRLENTLAELRAMPQRILMGASESRDASHG
ncbi:hypothetical protein PBI_MYXUS_53 [Mycobacterium phage Myxus]|uniref:Uncharacterized protein n=9 Tax=Fromanvirus TaxID=186764 RepID=A0A142K4W1_9CAUD|nr:hypothetical protein AVV05_gp056 [Mycobacterium phage Pioneer]YP_009301876.1 hypothetical protein BJD80_gp057 [Mycobacterium phage Catalina]YP_009636022.1 hypothetical protein FGG56_gp51 [Mycobacterium phage PackMan]AMO43921.1 hypothetical protein PBI_MYXUS_53 [Mycobacterium phage Myxus]AMS00853.1 hypothetical protein PBI_EIDSMOE_53 [Mycobacterium phage Eidsmoe]AOQ29009.1 hypothetical protein SEA_HORTUMSL17_53 [Mycobacterium phage HortumSL17]AOT26171.1 hypothetical protein SEA_QOBBIT_53 [M